MDNALLAAILGLLSAVIIVLRLSRQRPPGPRGIPIFGNTFQLPSGHRATYFKHLHARYGGLVYLNMDGKHVFSIGDIDLASELLERRSAFYSSRPVSKYLGRCVDPNGLIWTLAGLGENHYWGRKMSTTVMKHVRVGHTEPLQRLAALGLVQNFIADKGKDWYEQVNRMVATQTVTAMFGVGSMDSRAPEVEKVLELVDGIVRIVDPRITIMNRFPFIDDFIPARVHTPWRKTAETWRKRDAEGWDELFREALEGAGAHLSSWASMFADEHKERRQLLNQFAAAAIETSSISLHSFILACVAFPSWVEHAQEELDRVVGQERSPTFHDRPSLPFIEAVVREVLRWNPPVRMGLPHLNTADDVVKYRGKDYFIPKGSTILCPAYVMEHDPERYDSPHIFHPRRFLDENGQLKPDYRTASFGFGRRLCVGVPFAERTMWIVIASILWTFNIVRAPDPLTGLPFDYKTTDEAFDGRDSNGPLLFPVDFKPRDENRVAVAQREWEDYEKDLHSLLPPLKR